jgi:DNA polymerase III delta prime subunit
VGLHRSIQGRVPDPTKRSSLLQEFEAALRSKIVGQDEAIEGLAAVFQVFCAGLNASGRPVGDLLFLGPTGSGKTRIVEAAAEVLFGEKRAVLKIDCAEFQQALPDIHGRGVAVLDGHESHASYLRHCRRCLQRTIHGEKGDRIQYYHRQVTLMLLAGAPPHRQAVRLLLDHEPQRGEKMKWKRPCAY